MRRRCLLCAALLLVCVSLRPAGAADKRAKAPSPPPPVVAAPPEPTAADYDALQRAIADLTTTFGAQYPRGQEFLARLEAVRKGGKAGEFAALRTEALLANPLLDFERLLLVKRRATKGLGLPQNWQGNCALARHGFDNEIAVLAPLGPAGKLTTLYRPAQDVFVGDVDLHWDADRLLFSSIGELDRWHVFELKLDAAAPRQVTPSEPDVDNYDACYLPDGRIVFCSTACFQGVPCVGGRNAVANLCLLDEKADGATRPKLRRLCFDQDHSWCPTVTNDGRVMYLRWEYSDTPHYFTRLLFQMNPDGTGQAELYGSNSYWPNSLFYARSIPGHPSLVAGIVGGHHGVPRMGELVLFDTARGQREADGAVQRIPGHGLAVPALIRDGLVNESWPKFLHPYPLSAKYFLVSCKPTSTAQWGIYLADIFDNLLCIAELPEYMLCEPVPLRKTARPPVIPERVKLERKDATVYMFDIYKGEGLKDVPRGTVKKLRVYSFHFAYNGMGGHANIGIDGPWDVHRILGTVPVDADGSAIFTAPANTPLAVQPLDAEGKAVQVMRSWFTAMPGENLSCVGCHERQSDVPQAYDAASLRRTPSAIEEWHGPARGFSFPREVQPVVDKFCVGCHNGQPREGKTPPDLRRATPGARGFGAAYTVLHRYVNRPGPESDYHILPAMAYHADTSELVQMLKKGHHGVQLDAEAWDRLVTWIDLNVPCHGTWHEERAIPGEMQKRRMELGRRLAGWEEDPETICGPGAPAGAATTEGGCATKTEAAEVAFVAPPPRPAVAAARPEVAGWPFDATQAVKMQAAAGKPATCSVSLGDDAALEMVLVPAGEFVMGDANGSADEQPRRARIEKPFWVSKCEVTNLQFWHFDPRHDSRYFNRLGKDQSDRGIPLNTSLQPAVRVPWERAVRFCEWLTQRTGAAFTLPTEEQWEYACRAGAATHFNFGALDADFSKDANLADASFGSLSGRGAPAWHLAEKKYNDRALVTAPVGSYAPNAWGLCDMHGNVAEWTLSNYDADGKRKVVRGGSFADRPFRAGAAVRWGYYPWQGVYDVGFRIVCGAEQLPARNGVRAADAARR